MKHTYLDQPIDDESRVKVLLDADVLLELFVNRSGFVEDVERLLAEIEKSRQVEVYVTDKCLKRIRIEDDLGDEASSFVEEMVRGRVIKIDSDIRAMARVSCLQDYDSAEELACANARNLDAIITQNPQNFDGSTLPIWSVASLLERISLEKSLEKQYQQQNLQKKFIQDNFAAYTYFLAHSKPRELDILNLIKMFQKTHLSSTHLSSDSLIIFLDCCYSGNNIAGAKDRWSFLGFEPKQYISRKPQKYILVVEPKEYISTAPKLYDYFINSNPENQLGKSISYQMLLKALKKFFQNNKTDEDSNNNDFDSNYYE